MMPDRHTVEEVRADQVRKGDVIWANRAWRHVGEIMVGIDGALSFIGHEWVKPDAPILRRCPPVSER